MPLNTLLLKAMLPAIFIMGTHSMQQEKKKLYNDTLNLQLKEDLIWLLEILSNRKIYHKVFKTAFASERLYCIVAFQSPVYNLQFYFHIAFKKDSSICINAEWKVMHLFLLSCILGEISIVGRFPEHTQYKGRNWENTIREGHLGQPKAERLPLKMYLTNFLTVERAADLKTEGSGVGSFLFSPSGQVERHVFERYAHPPSSEDGRLEGWEAAGRAPWLSGQDRHLYLPHRRISQVPPFQTTC